MIGEVRWSGNQAHWPLGLHQLRAGDAERAAATATTVLDTVEGMESQRLRDRLVKMRRTMTALRSNATTEVVKRIDDTLRIPL